MIKPNITEPVFGNNAFDTKLHGLELTGKKRTFGLEQPKFMIKQGIKKKEINFSNTLDIPENLIDEIFGKIKSFSEEMQDIMLKEIIPLHIGYNSAVSFTEVVARDGLGLNVDIDTEVVGGMQAASRLAVLLKFIEKLQLSKEIEKNLVEKLVASAATDIMEQMKHKRHAAKMSKNIQELAGIVRTRSSMETTKPEPKQEQKTLERIEVLTGDIFGEE